jgi:small subunit ribosomal protein S20
LKTHLRKIAELIKANKVAEAETEFRATSKKLDKAAAANVIHANRAARVKSRLSVRLKTAKKK